jgi:bifunctional non-homologous end joining protein LigD
LPLEWNEIKKLKSANEFSLKKALAKIKRRKKDPWALYHKTHQKVSILKA